MVTWKSAFAYVKTKVHISTFVFATQIVQSLNFLNLKSEASSHIHFLVTRLIFEPLLDTEQ